VIGVRRHQRALVESGQDRLELAGIPVDVADGEEASSLIPSLRHISAVIIPVARSFRIAMTITAPPSKNVLL